MEESLPAVRSTLEVAGRNSAGVCSVPQLLRREGALIDASTARFGIVNVLI